jgi:tetratricopeptide (TPR) repeat protein
MYALDGRTRMVNAIHPNAVQKALVAATNALQNGNLAAAEVAIAPFLRQVQPNHDLLNLGGTLRMRQGRLADAADLFGQAATAAPQESIFRFNLGLTLSRLGRFEEAESALRAALQLKSNSVPALFELAALQHRTGRLQDAAKNIRQVLRLTPGNAHAELALGAILTDAGRPGDAENATRRGLAATKEPRLKAQLYLQLAQALRRQRKDADALAALDEAEALDPALPGLARHRAETLQHLSRFDEAIAIFKKELARAPDDPGLHLDYNSMLYQLGYKEEFLKSFDRAPKSREILLGKAFLLAREKHYDEAHAIYAGLKARDSGDRLAATGAAQVLTKMGRHGEAVALFETLLEHNVDPKLAGIAAEAALVGGDPEKAARICERALSQDARSVSCLAMLSIASRMMGDGRDEMLNGYDTLVRSFDLEPPRGYSTMESFNAELNGSLSRLHPMSREFIDQSLRGGTQTPGDLFPAGLPLVTLLKERIDEVVARYIAELAEDATHPFLSRRKKRFSYSGSWSSRLIDTGYHFNHVHPAGWISSCYYVSVPDAVKDKTAMQGWIKFGEPAVDVALKKPIRRTIQPAPGRLVLFPSYIWHGTVPFHDAAPRTTVAFDVVPEPDL